MANNLTFFAPWLIILIEFVGFLEFSYGFWSLASLDCITYVVYIILGLSTYLAAYKIAPYQPDAKIPTIVLIAGAIQVIGIFGALLSFLNPNHSVECHYLFVTDAIGVLVLLLIHIILLCLLGLNEFAMWYYDTTPLLSSSS